MKPIFATALLAAGLLLNACAGVDARARAHARQGDWARGMQEYRRAAAARPDDVALRSGLKRFELEAAEAHYLAGRQAQGRGAPEAALQEYRLGLQAMPENAKLAQALEALQRELRSAELARDAGHLAAAGKPAAARRSLGQALEADPGNVAAREALRALEAAEQSESGLSLGSDAPVTLNFKGTGLRGAFEFLGRAFGVNLIFDDGLKNQPVTLFAKDVTFEQGLNLLLRATQAYSRQVGPNTLLLAPDTAAKRAQYEDHIIRTFHLGSARAADMAALLKGVLNLKKVTVNERLNALVIRDSAQALRLAERVIEAQDRKPAEVVFDVEILEINRSKAEQLGLNYGTRIAAAFQPMTIGQLRASNPESVLGGGVVTLPALSFNFFKQDVDAKVLASPKIRALDGSLAKIHIGDRVPLRSSTIQDTTGQVRFTFEYRDIGIKLNVEPRVHLENSTTVKLSLEVSSLGANLGTDTEPAYSIGTRNAESVMLLRDGETAVLGGLIRDEERRTLVRIPGLGSIPLIGPLFTTSYDASDGRTDILLTITPHVVRGWDLAGPAGREIYSGSEDSYSDGPLFAEMRATAQGRLPVIEAGAATATVQAAAPAPASAAPIPSQPRDTALQPAFLFSEASYEVKAGEEVEITLLAEALGRQDKVAFTVAYNPDLLEPLEAAHAGPPVADLKSAKEAAKGLWRLELELGPGERSAVLRLLRLRFKGLKPGASYLVYQSPVAQDAQGPAQPAQSKASRVLVRR